MSTVLVLFIDSETDKEELQKLLIEVGCGWYTGIRGGKTIPISNTAKYIKIEKSGRMYWGWCRYIPTGYAERIDCTWMKKL